MTTPIPPKPPDQSVASDKPTKETSKERLARLRANSKTLTPAQIKELIQQRMQDLRKDDMVDKGGPSDKDKLQGKIYRHLKKGEEK